MMRKLILGTVLCLLVATNVMALDKVSATQKGSLLIYSKVEIRWDATGQVIQDTFIDLTNDYPGSVLVQMYFINGDAPIAAEGAERAHPGYNWVDVAIRLTANEPTYWSALTGMPKGVSPFTILDPGTPPGRPAADASGDRVLRGFVIAFAVTDDATNTIRWNHLKGDALLVDYANGTAWEYNTWAFQAASAAPDTHGAQTNNTNDTADAEVMALDGSEYDVCFQQLLLDFYASGSDPFCGGGRSVVVDTDLTLFPVILDLTQDHNPPVTTKAEFTVWNMNEAKFTNTRRCITFWDQTWLSAYTAPGVPNNFLVGNIHTNKGKAQVYGTFSTECDSDDVTSQSAPLLGVQAKELTFDGGADIAMAGGNLVGAGKTGGTTAPIIPHGSIKVGKGTIPPEKPAGNSLGGLTIKRPVKVVVNEVIPAE